MVTRDMVQGFIDGLKATGDDLFDLEGKVRKWLCGHHTYSCANEEIEKIVKDLMSYKK